MVIFIIDKLFIMNTSQTKIRKIQEANRIAEERFLISEQAVGQPTNPVASVTGQPDPIKKPIGQKLPTDFTKSITFLFPDFSTVILKPTKQQISKAIIEQLGLGSAPTNNIINLAKTGGTKKVCGDNQFTKKLYIFTRPNTDIEDWCSLSNISPQFMANNGIYEIPYKPEFVSVGNWRGPTSTPVK